MRDASICIFTNFVHLYHLGQRVQMMCRQLNVTAIRWWLSSLKIQLSLMDQLQTTKISINKRNATVLQTVINAYWKLEIV